ncbi:MAG TPA: ATP-binding protein [Thermoanaerobaculia bacterium]|jgi:predicted ATPase|nr:ATP-binding protein [Thermoanaerobaculia bacterium]
MLKRLYVDNYRCLVNFQLELQELTLLVGPNGSGKSSVLAVLFALRQLLSGVAKVTDPELFPTRSLTRWQDRKLQVFEVMVKLDDEAHLTYRLEVEHEKESRRARIVLESLKAEQKPLFEFQRGEVQLYRDNHSLGAQYSADWSESAMARVAARPINQRLTRFLDFMRDVSVCALDPKRFQSETVSEEPLLQTDGGNLASWYRYQIQERQDLVINVVETLRKVLEDFQSIRMERVGSEARAFIVVFEGQNGRYELRLDELSDGQRALIALYALINLAGDQDVLFLDEPDNYLSLAEIQPWLMALSDACGTRPRQAILCSHHPELIDYLGSEAGVLLKRESSGSITTRRLSEIPGDAGLKLSEIIARGWEL